MDFRSKFGRGDTPRRTPLSAASSPSRSGPLGAPGGSTAEKGTPKVVGVPLGSIIPRRLTDDPTLVLRHAPRSPLAERYRGLVHRIYPNQATEGRNQLLTITSSAPDEGKTTTSLNLALALAEKKDHSTLIIDADLRRPSVCRYLTPAPKIGLSDVLTGEARLEHTLLELKDTKLTVLPAGTLVGNPQELLRSEFVAALFTELRRRFDHIIIDTPPVVPFTDASVLSVLSDATMLVVRARKTPKPLVERALQALSSGNVIGITLNYVQITPVDRYYYKYDDYNPERYTSRDEGEERE